MTGLARLTPGQEARLAVLLADAAAEEERQRAQWRRNAERRERETLGRARRLADPSPWPRRVLVPKKLRTRVPCTAHRADGGRCGAWSIHGGWVCWAHGGAAPQTQRAARRRLEGTAIAGYVAMVAAKLAQAQEDADRVLGRELARLDADAAAARRRLKRAGYPLLDTGSDGQEGITPGEGGGGR